LFGKLLDGENFILRDQKKFFSSILATFCIPVCL